jgi:carbon storage regulator CsrA
MLILTRKVGEEVVVTLPSGDELSLFVTRIIQGTVKLGFVAPDHIKIDRREVLDLKTKKDP